MTYIKLKTSEFEGERVHRANAYLLHLVGVINSHSSGLPCISIKLGFEDVSWGWEFLSLVGYN
jgi:hypothetical protein